MDTPVLPGRVVLTELRLRNRRVPESAGSVLKRPLHRSRGLELSYRDYPLQHRIRSPWRQFTPGAWRYAYRLLDVDEGWIEASADDRWATFTRLPYGSHRLEVRTRLHDGALSSEGADLDILILPPWWDTVLFRVALLATVLLAALLLVRWRFAAVERRNRELEALVAERTRALRESRDALEQISLTDPLTGMRNRRFLEQVLPALLERTRRETSRHRARGEARGYLVSALIDVDHFKSINDRYGHRTGDQVLRELRYRLERATRGEDLRVRWGGEEFLCIMAGMLEEQISPAAERIRQTIAETPMTTDSGPLAVTCFRRMCDLALRRGVLAAESQACGPGPSMRRRRRDAIRWYAS